MKEQLSLSLMRDKKNNFPIKAVEFGEGTFIRGFLNELLYRLNDNNLFMGSVVAIAPTNRGKILPLLKAQDCLYTTVLHGIYSELFHKASYTEKIDVINTIVDALNPYEEWNKVLDLAKLDSLKFVFSNTTESGLVYKKVALTDKCPETYPAKLTIFLYTRFKHFKDKCSCGSGLYILPLEVLEQNGSILKDIVIQHAKDFEYEEEFLDYLLDDCYFLNTIVDRVVSGYPKEDSPIFDKLPYKDNLITEGELYHCMVIESNNSDIESLLPFKNIGLNVEYVTDIRPYAYRKLRVLNGTYTANACYSFLRGNDTVYESMQDKLIYDFSLSLVKDEILPNLILDREILVQYVDANYRRFKDPNLNHKLESILLNTSTKFRSRVLPTILDARKKGQMPKKLLFTLAATICLYKEIFEDGILKVVRNNGKVGYFRDDIKKSALLNEAWSYYNKTEDSAKFVATKALSLSEVWGFDLSADIDLCSLVSKYLHAISSDGVQLVIEDLME